MQRNLLTCGALALAVLACGELSAPFEVVEQYENQEADGGAETGPGAFGAPVVAGGAWQYAEPDAEPDPDTDTGPEQDTEPDPDTDTGPEQDTEPEQDTGQDTEPDTEPDTDTEQDTEPEPDTDTEQDTEPEPDTDTEPEPEQDTGTDAGVNADGGADADADTDTDADADADTDADADIVNLGPMASWPTAWSACDDLGLRLLTFEEAGARFIRPVADADGCWCSANHLGPCGPPIWVDGSPVFNGTEYRGPTLQCVAWFEDHTAEGSPLLPPDTYPLNWGPSSPVEAVTVCTDD
jgi:hypothetical protein